MYDHAIVRRGYADGLYMGGSMAAWGFHAMDVVARIFSGNMATTIYNLNIFRYMSFRCFCSPSFLLWICL